MDFLKENYTPSMIEQLAKEGHVLIYQYQAEMRRVYKTRGIRTKLYAKIDRKDGVPWMVNLTYESGRISKEVSKQIDELTEKFNKSIGKEAISWTEVPWFNEYRHGKHSVQVGSLNAPPQTLLEYLNQLENILCSKN
jgi:hypothetical protein